MPQQNRSVLIVGVGALGSHAALFARCWEDEGVELTILDFDRVEAKNVQSQFHPSLGKGRNKAMALQQALLGMFGRKVAAMPTKLTSANVQQLLLPVDLVIDCTDNYEARRAIQVFCMDNVPCLHGCLSADGSLARAVWTEHFNADSGGEGGATCEDGRNLPFHGLAGALIAEVAQHYLRTEQKRSWQLTSTSLIRVA